MQSLCLLFAGRRGLEETLTRNSILRIPEVSRKLKEAQNIIDQILEKGVHVDLYSFVQSTDGLFNSNSSLKSLVAGIVQIGLFDRFVKYRSRPQFLVGRINGCSAIKVCAGLQSIEDFIVTSDYCKENTLIARFTQQNARLAGVKLEEYGALQWNEEGFYKNLIQESKGSSAIMEELSSSYLVNQCVHVGPCYDFRLKEFDNAGLYNLSSMSSIDLDPILSSFWKSAI